MADTYFDEKDLGRKSSLSVNDFIRIVGTDNASYKQLISDVAKAIIENYSGSNVAGANQSVKAALDSLNSKLVIPSSVDVLDFAENIPGSNVVDCAIRFCVTDSSSANVPANGFCIAMSRAARRMVLLITIGGSIYTNSYDGSTWAGWKQATMS